MGSSMSEYNQEYVSLLEYRWTSISTWGSNFRLGYDRDLHDMIYRFDRILYIMDLQD